MRYINLRFTYLLVTYLLTYLLTLLAECVVCRSYDEKTSVMIWFLDKSRHSFLFDSLHAECARALSDLFGDLEFLEIQASSGDQYWVSTTQFVLLWRPMQVDERAIGLTSAAIYSKLSIKTRLTLRDPTHVEGAGSLPSLTPFFWHPA